MPTEMNPISSGRKWFLYMICLNEEVWCVWPALCSTSLVSEHALVEHEHAVISPCWEIIRSFLPFQAVPNVVTTALSLFPFNLFQPHSLF